MRLDVRRIESLKDGTDFVGNRTRVKVVKNKVAPPFKQAEFDIMYGQGISREGGLIDVGVETGFVRKAGAWYTYEGDQLGQGKENSRTFLRDNPDLANELEKRILEKLGIGATLDAEATSRPSPPTSTSEPPPAAIPTARPARLTSAMARRRQREPEDPDRDLGPVADPESVARTILLTKLTASAKSRRELADALAAKEVPDDVAIRVLDRFEQVGLVDDAAFADTWVRSRQASRGLSRRALSHELRRKGVADDLIADSLEQLDASSERAAAEALVARRLRSTRGLDPARRSRRLVGMLARKGYPPGLAMAVVREALAGDESVDEGSDGADRGLADWLGEE